jgi:hypothetical protein
MTFEAQIALHILENYVNGAIIQWNRIQVDKTLPGPGVDPLLFLDIHFYFICCDKVHKWINYLAKRDGKIKEMWKEREPKIRHLAGARHLLEHLEGLVNKKYLWDFGNLQNDCFTFGGEKFDISEAGLKIVTDTYKQITTMQEKTSELEVKKKS